MHTVASIAFSINQDTPIWLITEVWLKVIKPSWLSLISAIMVLLGYKYLGEQRRVGWLFNIASNTGLLIVGLFTQQWGLLVTILLIRKAYLNYRDWGLLPQDIAQLQKALRESRKETKATRQELNRANATIRTLQAQLRAT